MSLSKTELIVLKRVHVQDSSLFLICLTREFGKLKLVARGATKPGSMLAEALQYFMVADVVFYQREKESADYISKAEVSESFDQITMDEQKFGFASAALELVNIFVPEDEENRQLYFSLKKYLRLLDSSKPGNFERELLHFWYLLFIFSGYAPELERCIESGAEIEGDLLNFDPTRGGVVAQTFIGDATTIQLDRGTARVLRQLAGVSISDSRKVSLTAKQADQIKSILTAMTEYHIGRRADLKSLDFLRKLNLLKLDGGTSGPG
jgi:DNA repair protein RecO (recombination protein O)